MELDRRGIFFFRKLTFDGSAPSLTALFQIFCVGLAALIPLGSGADRWRLRASCLSTGVLAGCDLSSVRTLGVGRGLARATRRQLRDSAADFWMRGAAHNSSHGGHLGPRGHLDPGSPARKIFRGRYGAAQSRGITLFWYCSAACSRWSVGLDSIPRARFSSPEASRPSRFDRHQYHARRFCVGATAAFITKVRFGKPDASSPPTAGSADLSPAARPAPS